MSYKTMPKAQWKTRSNKLKAIRRRQKDKAEEWLNKNLRREDSGNKRGN